MLASLGKHETGKSCLYVKRLDDIDLEVLRTLVRESWEEISRRYPPDQSHRCASDDP